MKIILAINQELGVVHHQLGQFTVTREVFQEFATQLIDQAVNMFPAGEIIHIVYDGARPHLNIVVPGQLQHSVLLRILPPYSLFSIPLNRCLLMCIDILVHLIEPILNILGAQLLQSRRKR